MASMLVAGRLAGVGEEGEEGDGDGDGVMDDMMMVGEVEDGMVRIGLR